MSADDFLMGGGKKSAAFPTVGTQVTGTIVRVGEPTQQRDPATGDAKVFSNGDPMLQLPVDLQTAERLDADDDGIRVLYVKFNLRDAVRDAVRAANAGGLRVGGTLTVAFVSQDAPERPGLSGVKRYAATYAPPADTFLAETPPQPAAAPSPAPAAAVTTGADLTATLGRQPAQQTVLGAPTAVPKTDAVNPVEVAKSLIGLGQPNDVIAQATGLDLAVIAAVRNTVPVPA